MQDKNHNKKTHWTWEFSCPLVSASWVQAEERQQSARPDRAHRLGELLIRGRLNEPTLATRFTQTWPSPSEVPLSSDFASCVPGVVSTLPDALVFVVSAAGDSTWLESCRSLFSAGLLSATPGISASSTSSFRYTIVYFPRSLTGWGRAPGFALEYAIFLATSASDDMRSQLLRQDTATTTYNKETNTNTKSCLKAAPRRGKRRPAWNEVMRSAVS